MFIIIIIIIINCIAIVLACSSELTAVISAIGNTLANSVWEGRIQNKTKPIPSSSRYESARNK